jgi:hypothetical protein
MAVLERSDDNAVVNLVKALWYWEPSNKLVIDDLSTWMMLFWTSAIVKATINVSKLKAQVELFILLIR